MSADHKCGNHYYKSVFKNGPTSFNFCQRLKEECQANADIPEIDQEFLNIRCRNFDTKTVAALLNQVDLKTSKFFLFTASSFVLPLRDLPPEGRRKTGHENRYSYLNNQTCMSLNATHHMTKLIISMKHFGLAWNLIDRWIQNHRLLSIGAELQVIKTEESNPLMKAILMISPRSCHIRPMPPAPTP